MLLDLIERYCHAQQIEPNLANSPAPATDYVRPKSASAAKLEAFEMFRKGWSVDDVKHKLNRARNTVAGYLAEFIAEEKPASISAWVAIRCIGKLRKWQCRKASGG